MYDDEVISRKKPMKRSQMKTQTRKQIEEALYAEVEDIAQDIDSTMDTDAYDVGLSLDLDASLSSDDYRIGHGSHYYLVEP